MKMKSSFGCAVVFALCLLLWPGVSCAAGKLAVFVSILPEKYFVEMIGRDKVDVSVMVMSGASPATYEPTPRQMAGLTRAKVYFSVGVPFENVWLPRIRAANPNMMIVKADQGIVKMPMAAHHHGHVGDERHEHAGHEGHGHDGDHDHGILDPHIWLSPRLAMTMADNICKGLVAVDPGNRSEYEANLQELLKNVTQLDRQMHDILGRLPKGKRTFMVFHPSWGYFAQEFGLEQIPIEAEGKEPSPRDLARIVTTGREKGIRVVFVQPQFSDRSAKVIAAEMGATVVPLDPLAGNWKANMLGAAEAFRKALQ